LNWLGAYNSGTSYVIDDAVSYNGSSYICKLASTGNLPTNTTYWDILAEKGASGSGTGDVIGPASATANAIARYDGTSGTLIKNSSATISDAGDLVLNSTGAITVPVGTDLQRPTAVKGMFRFNDDSDSFEGYDGAAWGAIGGGGGATLLLVTNRSGSTVQVPLTNGFLAITNRSGGTVNVPVS
jgi:hypothetical protein